MSSFNELLQKWVNEDYETLVNMAKFAMVDVLPACKTYDPEHEGFLLISSIILSAVGADGKLSYKERCLMKDVLGLDDAMIDKYIGMYSSKMQDLVDKFADSMSSDLKAKIVMLVGAIAACDETISREETAFMHKILE